MTNDTAQRIGNGLLPLAAGIASFLFSLVALLYLTQADHKIVASVALGIFALLVCWIAAERPNSQSARAGAALVDRLLEVGQGDMTSPAPPIVHRAMPAVGEAVDHLFAQVRASLDAAQAIALYDPVTGLPNRVHFRQEAEKRLDARAAGTVAALMFVDLDRFKAINDNLGHARGDEALVAVAERLGAVARMERGDGSRPTPLVARLAGDEFIMFFPFLDEVGDAHRIARRVLLALSEPLEIGGQTVDIGASVGVAMCPVHGCELPALMRSSDIAMYQAKSAGRGQVCVYDDALARDYNTRMATEADLRSALGGDEFELYFQPQVSPGTRDIVAVEALLRWHHPRDGLRMPGSFVSVAEECGLMIDIGDWVIDAVGETLAQWRAAGIDARLALNVSPRQLDRSHFFVRLREAMARAGADLNQLELEFTEDATVALDRQMLEDIAALRNDGVLIALDDFGTGYSNLARLKEMPLDRIKIDDSLIWEIDTSESARSIVHGIVQIVHGIGCLAVAEGVENEAQAEMLRLIGCDTLQGYAFAEPMTGADLLRWMADRSRDHPSMRVITAA